MNRKYQMHALVLQGEVAHIYMLVLQGEVAHIYIGLIYIYIIEK